MVLATVVAALLVEPVVLLAFNPVDADLDWVCDSLHMGDLLYFYCVAERHIASGLGVQAHACSLGSAVRIIDGDEGDLVLFFGDRASRVHELDANLAGAANDFEALERLRKLAFAVTVPAPKIPEQLPLELPDAPDDNEEM